MAKRGRKPKYDLSCPNPQCALFGKTGAGNIVSNGTHPNDVIMMSPLRLTLAIQQLGQVQAKPRLL